MSDALFEAFVLRHQDLVFATAVRLLGNRRDAEDIAQNVFLKAYQHFGEISGHPGAAAWLKTVTTNDCLNHLSRYRSRWRLFSELGRQDAEGEHVDYEMTLAANSTPADALESADRRRQLATALLKLPPHQRVPLVLFHFDQMSYQDIAARLGVTLAKIKSDIHRGREVLAKLLG
jgi:RNA polymerase sigma-70 factor, ECF subfamily